MFRAEGLKDKLSLAIACNWGRSIGGGGGVDPSVQARFRGSESCVSSGFSYL